MLIDQGHLDDAERLLLRARRLWTATADEAGVAYATALLGRIAVRRGMPEEGHELLEDATTRFRALGIEDDAAWADALMAEALAFAFRAEEALELARRVLRDRDGDGRVGPLMHRVSGYALMQLGRPEDALTAFTTSLEHARGQELDYDVAAALDALEALGDLIGISRDRGAGHARRPAAAPARRVAAGATAGAPARSAGERSVAASVSACADRRRRPASAR